MQYARTPLKTGISQSELLNGRQIHTKLDALKLSLAHEAQTKQAQQTSKGQLKEKNIPVNATIYRGRVGAPCYALYFSQKWKKNLNRPWQ